MSDVLTDERWYCVHTKPREETFAAIHLERQGYAAFLPFIRLRRMYRRKLQWHTSPMFPRYLFVQTGDDTDCSRIRSTRGVSSLVTFGGSPALVPPVVIAEIRQRCTDDICVVEDAAFQAGDTVEVAAGPYQGMQAIFDRNTSNDQRVVILMEIMAVVAPVEIDREILIKPES